MENEVGKYRKKKKSSTSKSSEKSKHKHLYKKCLFKTKDYDPMSGSYCEICGKIGELHFFETISVSSNACRLLDGNEILEKYKDLEIIEVKNIWQKYIPIKK